MNEPTRIQLRRAKGWRKPAGAIVVARPSRWGNPFAVRSTRARSITGSGTVVRWFVDLPYGGALEVPTRPTGLLTACSLHRAHLLYPDAHDRQREEAALVEGRLPFGADSYRLPYTVDDVRRELSGRHLACWCPLDQPCHADVLLEVANTLASEAR